MKKKCCKCKEEKVLREFYKNKQKKDGLQYMCKQCTKEYYEANKKRLKEYRKEYYQANTEKIEKYRKANREYRKEYNKKYREANREKINSYNNNYLKAKLKTDSMFRLTNNLRSTVKRYLKGGKNKRTEAILGMNFKAFKHYIGKYDSNTHLDHIIPLSWAKNEEEVYTLNHYSNFQLLTEEENLTKGDRFAKADNVRRVFKEHNNKLAIAKIILRNNHKIILK